MPDPQPMIIVDRGLVTPADRQYWTGPEMFDIELLRPRYYIAETARCFFAMSPGWVRHHLLQRYEDSEGLPFELPRTQAGDRYFRLYDIERWAHTLAAHRVIQGRTLELVVGVVKINAQLHRFIS